MSEEQETAKAPETSKPDQDQEAKPEDADKTPEEPPKEMRAVVLTNSGGLKSVKVQKKPEPAAALAEGEVLIRVKACGLNFLDVMGRLGLIDPLPKHPFIMGFECAGVVEKTHEGVEKFKVGDRVVALPEYGAWAELVTVPQQYIFPLPADLSFSDATALTTSFIIAHILLFDLGGLSPGKNVLIVSAGGGVGQAVAQLCKTVPDVTVIGVASKVKHEAIKGTVDHLLERGTDYVSEVRKISPDGIDIFLDCLYGEDYNRGYSLLKPLGKYVLFGSTGVVTGETKSLFSAARSWWQVDKITPIKLFDENKTLAGLNLRRLLHRQNGSAYITSIYEKVIALWNENKIKPVVDSTFALEDVAEAMQTLHDRKNIGRIVLDPSLEPKPKPATPAKGKAKNNDKEEKKKEEEENKENKENKDSPDAENKEKENAS